MSLLCGLHRQLIEKYRGIARERRFLPQAREAARTFPQPEMLRAKECLPEALKRAAL